MTSKRAHNALTHGLYAREPTLPWEDPKAFAAYRDAIREELNPDGPLEEAVAREVAELQWRKQRLTLGWLLQYYKQAPSAELVVAAKGGLEALAAYLHDLPEAEVTATRTLWMTSMQALDYIKQGKATRGTTENAATEAPPAKRSTHSADLPEQGNAERDIIEHAYNPSSLERQLKTEAMIDARIAKGLARLVGLKEYKKLYGQKTVMTLPPAASPPVALTEPVAQIPNKAPTGVTPETDEPQHN